MIASPAAAAAVRPVLWHACLSAVPEDDAPLSPDERERAARFRVEEARSRFVRSRLLVRTILGRRLGVDPAAVRFVYGADGKPSLPDGQGLACGWSHSGDLLVLALAEGGSVGVDAERARPVRSIEGVAGFALTPAELAWWRDLPDADRLPVLLRAWTRKEALAKADGRGLRLGLRGVPVLAEAAGGSPARAGEAALPDGSRLHWADWTAPSGWVGAVASDRPIEEVVVLRWDEAGGRAA